jgi:hypothetical protein
MLADQTISEIKTVWDTYISSEMVTRNTKGEIIDQIDARRLVSIEDIKIIMSDFIAGASNINEFKTSLDSYNKKHNFWGFTATKGQMFFNLLVRNNETNLSRLTEIIKTIISQPVDLDDAMRKIALLENFAKVAYENASDKRRVAHPSSAGYFTSYYWQIHDYQKWPIMYSSLVNAFKELRIWKEDLPQGGLYKQFYTINQEIKSVLSKYTGQEISNWDAEHAFWSYAGARRPGSKASPTIAQVERNGNMRSISPSPHSLQVKTEAVATVETLTLTPNFDINDYLIPKVSKLLQLAPSNDQKGSSKGVEYERLVVEIFSQLDFEVEFLGQGTGRNPDAIIKFRQDHVAFIVDAKAYANGYSLGTDDRAMKEYISYHCPRLQKDGFNKIGFIIVSDSFRNEMEDFINDITWNTDIKRFILLTSEALLYLLAYKTKDKFQINRTIEFFIAAGPVIMSRQVIEEFEDV